MKLLAFLAVPALALSLSSVPAVAGQSPVSRFQVVQQNDLFEGNVISLGDNIMTATPQLWTDSLRVQYDTVRHDVLDLDTVLEQNASNLQDIQARFMTLSTDFTAFRQSLSSFGGQLGSTQNDDLNAAINAFTILQSDISSIQ